MDAKKYTLFILGLVLFISCKNKEINNSDVNNFYSVRKAGDIELNLVKKETVVLQSPEQNSIGLPLYQVEFSNTDNLYFFNTIKNSFLVYDSDGVFIKSFGRYGRGPKEFEQVMGYTLDQNDNLYVYDDLQKLVKVFDKNFELVNTKEIDNTAYYISSHDILVHGSDLIFGVIETRANSLINNPSFLIQSPPIMLVDINNLTEERFLGTYDPYLKEIESSYNRPLFAFDKQANMLLVSHQNTYRFQEYDLKSGKRIHYFGVKDETFGEGQVRTKPGTNKRKKFMDALTESDNQRVFYTSQYLGNFYINGTEAWLDTKDLNDLNYYLAVYAREDYQLLDVIPSQYRLIGVHNEQFYFIEDEDPLHFKIGVYEIEVN